MQRTRETKTIQPINAHDKDAWRAISQEWEQSNETRQQFCKKRGLNPHTLSYWRSKFIAEDKVASKPSAFIPVQVSKTLLDVQASNPVLTVKTPLGYVVSVPLTMDNAILEKVFILLGLRHA